MVGYQIYRTYLKIASRELSTIVFSIWRLLRVLLVFQNVFILPWFEIFYCIITFLIAIVIGDLKQVFFVYLLLDSGIDTYCKKVLVSILFSSTMALRTSLVVLVFFIVLALMGRRWLLPIRYVSKGNM